MQQLQVFPKIIKEYEIYSIWKKFLNRTKTAATQNYINCVIPSLSKLI